MRVKLLDANSKMCLVRRSGNRSSHHHHRLQIDDSHTVGEIVSAIGSKLGIENYGNYSLYVEGQSQVGVSWATPFPHTHV